MCMHNPVAHNSLVVFFMSQLKNERERERERDFLHHDDMNYNNAKYFCMSMILRHALRPAKLI